MTELRFDFGGRGAFVTGAGGGTGGPVAVSATNPIPNAREVLDPTK